MGCFVVGGEFFCCCWGVFVLLGMFFLVGGNFLLRACVQWDVLFLFLLSRLC